MSETEIVWVVSRSRSHHHRLTPSVVFDTEKEAREYAEEQRQEHIVNAAEKK